MVISKKEVVKTAYFLLIFFSQYIFFIKIDKVTKAKDSTQNVSETIETTKDEKKNNEEKKKEKVCFLRINSWLIFAILIIVFFRKRKFQC